MQRYFRFLSVTAAVVAVATLAGCADPYYRGPAPVYRPAPVVTAPPPVYAAPPPVYAAPQAVVEFGHVANIEVMQGAQPHANSGAGAILGAVIGGVIGNQFGRGGGRALATGAGVFGGAIAGNAVENSQPGRIVQSYRIVVQIDRGGPVRAFDVPSPGDLRIGDRVRIENNQLQRL